MQWCNRSKTALVASNEKWTLCCHWGLLLENRTRIRPIDDDCWTETSRDHYSSSSTVNTPERVYKLHNGGTSWESGGTGTTVYYHVRWQRERSTKMVFWPSSLSIFSTEWKKKFGNNSQAHTGYSMISSLCMMANKVMHVHLTSIMSRRTDRWWWNWDTRYCVCVALVYGGAGEARRTLPLYRFIVADIIEIPTVTIILQQNSE